MQNAETSSELLWAVKKLNMLLMCAWVHRSQFSPVSVHPFVVVLSSLFTFTDFGSCFSQFANKYLKTLFIVVKAWLKKITEAENFCFSRMFE